MRKKKAKPQYQLQVEKPEYELQLEAVRGWKYVSLTHDRDKPFSGHNNSRYGQVAVAECKIYLSSFMVKPHLTPSEECTCGFYAYNSKPKKITVGQVLLEVELYGRVFICEWGYRAEKQRVIAAYGNKLSLTQRCTEIRIGPQQANHDGYWIPSPSYQYSCDCPGRYEIVRSGRVVCAEHALGQKYRFVEIEPEVPDLGGIEWHWLEEG